MSDANKFTIASLATVASVERGISWSASIERREPGSRSYPVLRIPNVKKSLDTTDLRYLTLASRPDSRFFASPGTLIMVGSNGNIDRIGNIAYVDQLADFLFASFLMGIKPANCVHPRYLFHVLSSSMAQDMITRSVQGTTGLKNLSLSFVRYLKIPLPSAAEQPRIAEILDSVDESIRSTERLIAKLQEVKTALVSATLEQAGRRSRLGEFVARGPQNGLYKAFSAYGDSCTPIVRIDSFDDGVIHSLMKLKRVRLSPSEQRIYALLSGDLLVNRVNTIDLVGKSALVPHLSEPTVFESNIMRLAVDRNLLLPEYASLWLCGGEAKAHFLRSAKSAIGQASVNQRDVESCPIVVPSLAEQLKAVSLAVAAETRVREEQHSLTKLRKVKQGLMEDLLTGRVRVTVGEDVSV